MMIVLSPAKTLDFETKIPTKKFSLNENGKQSMELIEGLRKLSSKKIAALMDLSEKLSDLNVERYKNFSENHDIKNSRPAIFTFDGEVANGLDAFHFSAKELEVAQNKIRFLSGLYGMLKPLDLIQPYRLEMGTSLGPGKYKNLYSFWGHKITEQLNKELKGEALINLASNEYFKVINTKKISSEIITCTFKEKKGKEFKPVMVFAKRARGMMANYIIKNNIKKTEDLKNFDVEKYGFNEKLSSENEWIFTR
ncbi:MAG: peroxide stress protein YaaA [Flavobacteriales bacterium]